MQQRSDEAGQASGSDPARQVQRGRDGGADQVTPLRPAAKLQAATAKESGDAARHEFKSAITLDALASPVTVAPIDHGSSDNAAFTAAAAQKIVASLKSS